MTFRIDLSDLTANLGLEEELNEQIAKDVADKIALDLHAGLVRATPVDTGRARAGWTVDTGPKNPIVENNVEYVGALNDGHSKQAPAGFIENEIDRVTRF